MADDCLNIPLVRDSSIVNLTSGVECATNGNRKWCDAYVSGTCHVSVGWDMTSHFGIDGPELRSDNLAIVVGFANLKSTLCIAHMETVLAACIDGKPAD